MQPAQPRLGEPAVWYLFFATRSATWFANWFALGRHKHVCALGFVAEVEVWVLYDVQMGRTQIAHANKDGFAELCALAETGEPDVIAIKPLGHRRFFPPAFFCTTAIKHLIGLNSSALRPTAVFRECLRNGGRLINEQAAGAATAGFQRAI